MTRLFLATAIVLHLSGVVAVGGFLCSRPDMTVQNCCCHHQAADRQSPPSTPVAAPTCPCTMAPPAPVPVRQTPATVSVSRVLAASPAIPVVWAEVAGGLGSPAANHAVLTDFGPPLVSVSRLRC